MYYFINGGGREFDHLHELNNRNWFIENGIKTLLVIPLAIKEEHWQERWNNPTQLFDGSPDVTSITTYTDREEAINRINSADAIYFPGGSQETLIRRLVDEMHLLETIKSATNLKAIGGGCAGMMAMGESVLVGASTIKRVDPGLNLIPETIFDSHFTKHSRLKRLKKSLVDLTNYLGYGIDENTGAILNDQYEIMKIIGPGTLTKIGKNREISVYDQNTLFN